MPNGIHELGANVQVRAERLVGDAARAAAAAPNEANLRHMLERSLDEVCSELGRPLDPFRLEFFVRE